ncbi:uncharacterized protein BXZ73DRAFT_10350, partial [Epithele typhae]|uniref:uncharacterized protein n=1 Tax=Epithele typhae TaxID=378194 RepID=UPI0020080CF5
PIPFLPLPDSPETLPRPREHPDDFEEAMEGIHEATGEPAHATVTELLHAEAFVRDLRTARLPVLPPREDDEDENIASRRRLQEPRQGPPKLDKYQFAGLKMFLARGDASEHNYMDNRAAFLDIHPDDPLPTYDGVKKLISSVTGVYSIRIDMCLNSCIAYTGLWKDKDVCPFCNEPRYDQWKALKAKKVARRTFQTFPVGPQLQAM